MPRPLVFLILALPLAGAYAMYASGIVVIYQSSRVVNLAHGAMATIPAYVAYSLSQAGIPIGLAFPLAAASGALIGIGVERLFVRRLRPAGSTAQTVGTVAAFGLLISLAAKIWGTEGLQAPRLFPDQQVGVGSSFLQYGQIGLCAVAVIATVALILLFHRTWFGLAMRGAAENRRAASLMGVSPDTTSTVAWAVGGALAATAGILLAAVTTLHPYTLSLSVLPAYVAALIGGMQSLKGALYGAGIVGILIGFVPVLSDLPVLDRVLGQVGGPQLVLAVAAMVVMAIRGSKHAGGEDVRAATEQRDGGRMPSFRVPKVVRLAAVAALALWVFIPGVPFSVLGDANQALLYVIAAASVVLLTGWIGQISLAQAAFVGIGAFGSIKVSESVGIPFPFTLPVAGAIAAAAAVALGAVALRVRGLYLAVATLIVAWMADEYLFSSPWLAGAGGSAGSDVTPIGVRGGFPYFDVGDRRTFYLVALAVAAMVLLALANLRKSKTGRAFFSIRGSEIAAASLGVNVARYKLLGFAMSGFIAGVAGNLIATGQGTIVPSQFALTISLLTLAIAVVGGVRSLGGAVFSSVLFAALNELFFRVDAWRGWLDVVSAGLLVAVLLFYPGGLAQIPRSIAPRLASMLAQRRLRPRMRVDRAPQPNAIALAWRRLGRELRWFGRELAASGASTVAAMERHAPVPMKPSVRAFRAGVRGIGDEAKAIASSARSWFERVTPLADVPAQAEPALAAVHDPVLLAEQITVSYGGLVAVEDASLTVRPGQIVGLIGPNGAGKTTMFNAIAGFVAPAAGTVLLNGRDVTATSVHERASLGMGRTFQQIQLPGDLTVRENLLAATHAGNDSGVGSHLIVGRRSAAAERAAATKVEQVAWTLGIEDALDRLCGGLSFGTLRMVELARAVVTGAPLLLLDEPASGLDDVETARLSTLLQTLRDELFLSILLIEHDVSLVMGLCDHIYVLDGGRPVADGTPGRIRTNPSVIAAYLGQPA